MSATVSEANPVQLAPGEVQCWCAGLDLPPQISARLYATLSSDERERSAHFRFGLDQRRFVAAHGVLRDLLARYLRTPPARIRYVYNVFGKPDLSPEFGGRLKFNLTHSAGLALIAIAADSNVGVDLEYVRAESDYAEIARRFFSGSEVDQLAAVPKHLYAEAFSGCWTKKEAYLKARGDGLAEDSLKGFSVPLATDAADSSTEVCVASKDIVRTERWSFFTLHPAPGYIGALAIEGSGWRLYQSQWRSTP